MVVLLDLSGWRKDNINITSTISRYGKYYIIYFLLLLLFFIFDTLFDVKNKHTPYREMTTIMSTAVIKTQLIQAWQNQPAIRFATSGIIGNGIFFGLDTLLYPLIVVAAKDLVTSTASASPSSKRRLMGNVANWVGENAASVSFFVAYLLDIFVQHFLNAWLVFGLDTIRTRALYLSSLTSAYTA